MNTKNQINENNSCLYSHNHLEHEHSDHKKKTLKLLNAGNILQVLFLIAAIGLMITMPTKAYKSLSITFVSIVLEAVPFILIGVLISGLIEVFVPKEKITAILPKSKWLTVFISAGLGLIFPVCECAIVPVIRRLLKKGIPVSAAIAYLLGGPIVNPMVAASTAVAYSFSWNIVIMRIIIGYIIASFVGIMFDFIMSKHPVVVENIYSNQTHECYTSKNSSIGPKIINSIQHSAEEFYDIARFLIMGAFIAAVLQTLVPRSLFTTLIENPVLSIILMMVLAIVLSLCSEADAFVAASFKPTGMPLSAQMAFMVLGPMLETNQIIQYV